MTKRVTRNRRKLLLFAAGWMAVAGPAAMGQAPASSLPANAPYVPTMTFDVISIRPIKTEPGSMYFTYDGGFQPSNSSHYRMRSVTLWDLLAHAFSLKYYQMPSLTPFSPPIARQYAIEARCDEDADKRLAELPKAQREAEQQHMLQEFLRERFHLKVHWEDRLLPGYRLVIAKHGSKLLPAGSLPRDADGLKWKSGDDGKIAPYHVHRDALRGSLVVARGASLEDIVGIAYVRTMSPVQDATGLDGKYDFDLKVGDRTSKDNPEENPQAWPQIADTLQSELGLRLEPAQVMQKVLVIDHLEAPSPN